MASGPTALLKGGVYTVMFGGILVMLVLSMIVRDLEFIKEHASEFFVELIAVALFPSMIIVLVFSRTRGLSKKDAVFWFFSFFLKFAIFHILFQTTGLYGSIFNVAA